MIPFTFPSPLHPPPLPFISSSLMNVTQVERDEEEVGDMCHDNGNGEGDGIDKMMEFDEDNITPMKTLPSPPPIIIIRGG